MPFPFLEKSMRKLCPSPEGEKQKPEPLKLKVGEQGLLSYRPVGREFFYMKMGGFSHINSSVSCNPDAARCWNRVQCYQCRAASYVLVWISIWVARPGHGMNYWYCSSSVLKCSVLSSLGKFQSAVDHPRIRISIKIKILGKVDTLCINFISEEIQRKKRVKTKFLSFEYKIPSFIFSSFKLFYLHAYCCTFSM